MAGDDEVIVFGETGIGFEKILRAVFDEEGASVIDIGTFPLNGGDGDFLDEDGLDIRRLVMEFIRTDQPFG